MKYFWKKRFTYVLIGIIVQLQYFTFLFKYVSNVIIGLLHYFIFRLWLIW